MFCSNCGTKLENDSKFCKSCGNSAKSSIEPNKESSKSSSRSFEKIKNFFSINTKTLPTLGILLFLLGIGTQTIHYAVGGIILLIGSAVYKSAKARKLGTVKNSFLRISSEIVALFVLVIILLFQPNAHVVNVEEPIGFFILIWILTAYIYLHLTKYLGENRKKKIAVAVGVFVLLTFGIQFFPFYYPYFSQVNSNSKIQNTESMTWQTFSPTTGFFSVLLPIKPTYEFSNYGHEDGVQTSYNQELYQSRVGDNLFIIKRITYPTAVDLETDPQSILNSMVEFVITSTPSATLKSSNFTSSGKDKIMDFSANTTEGVYIKGRFILADQVIYQLYLYSTDSGNNNYAKFIESFEHK